MIGPQHWQSIFGRFTISKDLIRFIGPELSPEELIRHPSGSAGMAMSNANFGGGSIRSDVRWDVVHKFPAIHLTTYRDPFDGSSVSAGIENGGGTGADASSRFVIRYYDTTGHEPLSEPRSSAKRLRSPDR